MHKAGTGISRSGFDSKTPVSGRYGDVAKLVKAPDFDSGMRRFKSCHPCHLSLPGRSYDPLAQSAEHLPFKQGVRSSNLRWITRKKRLLSADKRRFLNDMFRCAKRDVSCGRDACGASDVRFARERNTITSLRVKRAASLPRVSGEASPAADGGITSRISLLHPALKDAILPTDIKQNQRGWTT